MVQTQTPVMRLIGSLRLQESDWDLAGYRALFESTGALAKEGVVTRLVRYAGETGGRTALRFFGVAAETIANIPQGMTALELNRDSFRIYQSMNGTPVVSWQDKLTWNWLDETVPNAPVGDFTALFPSGRASMNPRQSVEFTITANAYFQKDKPANDDVRLTDYDPDWPQQYEAMAQHLRDTIPPEIIRRIEHYGSTSIPGMPAKPVIDILLEVSSFPEARRALIPIFNKPECEYWWYGGHLDFVIRKEFAGTRTHHIHAAPAGHEVWQGITFRDYLRAHPEDAGRYAALKRELAAANPKDREEYTNAKTAFVNEILAKALKK